ncbi:class I SAM-dependent DNA methyltransferase [Leuconostoc holzapfelii]|uniref:Class I SAM-dependent methyltransferase n=1 Tax=Leuconostoc holzapfelii TaxID=434464 RepID=A0A846ZH11_9LACO|nr:class I SAM-dependent methyltransferase [Leuconostoc holzapfelii]NKZ18500.1 class I SAM-dependent methyltransferase [Leuconostoc holzapfelii]
MTSINFEQQAVFDGYAQTYDQWFMANAGVFKSELALLHTVIGQGTHDKILSIGCGSGLFEQALKQVGVDVADEVEPSKDMAAIAEKRGVSVQVSTAEAAQLPDAAYDVIYFNGSASYMQDLDIAVANCLPALKPDGRLIIIDIPKESAYGLLYLLASQTGAYDDETLAGVAPQSPYPVTLTKPAIWRTTAEKTATLERFGLTKLHYMQTLRQNPVYSNDAVEVPVGGYQAGSYVAIIAEKATTK